MSTIVFSDRFINAVTELYGSEMKPEFAKALKEGDYETVGRYLRAEAVKQIRLKELVSQFSVQLGAYKLPAHEYI